MEKITRIRQTSFLHYINRSVLPYSHGPSVRKLSKIATLLLAKNYILLLTATVRELQSRQSQFQEANPLDYSARLVGNAVHSEPTDCEMSPTTNPLSVCTNTVSRTELQTLLPLPQPGVFYHPVLPTHCSQSVNSSFDISSDTSSSLEPISPTLNQQLLQQAIFRPLPLTGFHHPLFPGSSATTSFLLQ